MHLHTIIFTNNELYIFALLLIKELPEIYKLDFIVVSLLKIVLLDIFSDDTTVKSVIKFELPYKFSVL